jgi:hypothetical protein
VENVTDGQNFGNGTGFGEALVAAIGSWRIVLGIIGLWGISCVVWIVW